MPVVVYGIVEPGTKLPRDVHGIDGGRPRRVDCGSVAALVGNLERDDLAARRRDLRAHMDVLAAALERSTVAPMQFGVLMADDDDVEAALLRPLEDRLRELLDRFENLVELRLSVRYDEQALLSEIVSTDPRVRRLRGVAGAELALGELVSAAYERTRARDAGELLDRLETLIVDEARAEGRQWDLLTASFLVRRAHVPAIEDAVERWAESQAGRATAELAGPMPPYSFVELEAPEAAWA